MEDYFSDETSFRAGLLNAASASPFPVTPRYAWVVLSVHGGLPIATP